MENYFDYYKEKVKINILINLRVKLIMSFAFIINQILK